MTSAYVEQFEQQIKDGKIKPEDIYHPSHIRELADIRRDDMPEYMAILNELKKRGISIQEIKRLIKEIDRNGQKLPNKVKKVPNDIMERAEEILKDGTAFTYIYDNWQKGVRGNSMLGKALIVSRPVNSILNAFGINAYAHGHHGYGKSYGMEAAAELVPPEFMMDQDISPMTLYYASQQDQLLPASTIFVDEMVWSTALGGIIKKITSARAFQHGAGHGTVIDGKYQRFTTKPRINIWTNSRDIQVDEQIRDRFLDIAIEENCAKEIQDYQKTRDTLPDKRDHVDEETLVCQQIGRDIAVQTFTVDIPFAPQIEFPITDGPRGYNIFGDIIRGLTVWDYRNRERDEYGNLIAKVEDFKLAKEIYEGVFGHSETKYTEPEKNVLQVIVDNGYRALKTEICDLTGLSEGRVSDIMNGKNKGEQQRHGLLYKCPSLRVDYVQSTKTTYENADHCGSAIETTVGKAKRYSLPKGFVIDSKIDIKLKA